MGNCQSDYRRHHVRMENPGLRKLGPSKRKAMKIIISCKGQNGIYLDQGLDPTMPLSPDATTLTTVSSFSTPPDPFESPSPVHLKKPGDDGRDELLLSPSDIRALDISPYKIPTTSKSRKSRSPSKSSTRNRYDQTRQSFSSALRARLERSTFTQTAMVSPGDTESYRDSDIPFFSRDLYRTNLASRFSEEMQDEKHLKAFSDDKENIWAEIETSDSVTAVSTFRHQMNLNRINLAVVTKNGSITVYEILATSSTSDRLVAFFTLEHKTGIRSIDFSSDGRFFAIGGDDCICTIFRLEYDDDKLCGATILAKIERVDRVRAVQFCPRNHLLAIGGFDGMVAIISTETSGQEGELKIVTEINADGLVFALDWSPDGRYLAIGKSNKKCTIVDASKAWEVTAEVCRPAPIHSVKWSPANNGDLAIGSSNTAIFDMNKKLIKQEIAIKPKTFYTRNSKGSHTMSWSPDGNYFVSCDSVDQCIFFETKTFAKVQEIYRPGSNNSLCWARSPGDSCTGNGFLVIGGEDKRVAILKAGNEARNTKSPHYEQSIDLVDSIQQLGSRPEVEWVFDENAFKEIDDFDGVSPSCPFVRTTTRNVLAVTFSRGSKSRCSSFMAYTTDDNQVTVLSTSDWRSMAEISFPQPVTALAFTNGSKYLAYGCLDSRLYVSETFPNWSLVANVELPSPIHNSLIYSRDNQLLGAGTYDGRFVLLDPEEKYAVKGSIEGNGSPITSVDWTLKTLAIGKEDGTVKLYDSETVPSGDNKVIATITKKNAIRSVAFGLSGRFLAIGMSDGLVGIYSEKGGWVLCHQLQSLEGGVNALTWSSTSRYLAVGDDRGSMRVMDTVFWADVEKAKQAFNEPNENAISSPKSALSFSQDGKLLAFAKSNNGVRVADCTYWRSQFCLTQVDDDDFNVNSKVEEV